MRKKLSVLAGKKFAVLKGTEKYVGSLLAGKLSLEKEVCVFEWCLVLSQKYTKSFGGKNSSFVQRICPIKTQSICLISG